jgi:hypothetical protein
MNELVVAVEVNGVHVTPSPGATVAALPQARSV